MWTSQRRHPLESARFFDHVPVRSWPLNKGPFGNLKSAVSSLRHRIMPLSPPQRFTAQKCAVVRYATGMGFSEGFHFATGIRPHEAPICFLHFKYSSDFARRAEVEVQRKQHFSGAEEYIAYLDLMSEGVSGFWDRRISREIASMESDVLRFVLDGVSWDIGLPGTAL